MNNIETLEVDGLEGDQKAKVLEHELEASAEAGLSIDQLIETFNPSKLENLIDNQAAEILEIEREIEILAKEEHKDFNRISLLSSLKALKIQKIRKWSAIQDSVKTKKVTQEALDNEIARIEILNGEIQDKVAEIKALTK